MPRSRAALLVGIAVLAGAVLAPGANAQTSRLWPDSVPPCDGALQACIDMASPGDVIRLAPNEVIEESIAFSKPLTLRAEAGHFPVFGAGHSIHASTSESGDQTIRIEGVTLEQGGIEVDQKSTGTSTIEIVGNTIESKDPTAPAAINIVPLTSAVGPLVFQVSGNTVSVQEDSSEAIRLRLGIGPAANGSVRGNTLVLQKSGLGIAIYDATSVDVVANRIVGASGIFLFTEGSMTARVLDNLVNNVGSGIDYGNDSGALDLKVVNNTIAGGQYGILLEQTDGTEVTAAIANNAITGNSVAGLQINAANPQLVSLSEHHDLFFDNAADVVGDAPGAGSIFDNPLYAGVSDFHPQPGSPAIDAGDDASVPPDLTTDLDGNPRIRGQRVDIGAFETAPEPAAGCGEIAIAVALLALARGRHVGAGRIDAERGDQAVAE